MPVAADHVRIDHQGVEHGQIRDGGGGELSQVSAHTGSGQTPPSAARAVGI